MVVIELVAESIEVFPHPRHIGICDVLLTQKLNYQPGTVSTGMHILDKRLKQSASSTFTGNRTHNSGIQRLG